MKINPMTAADYYKLGHLTMDVPGVKRVLSIWTPRHHKYTPENEFTVAFGAQYVVKGYFQEFFNDFFNGDFEWYAADFRRKVEPTFNATYIEPIIKAFKALHQLGYLPIEVWALPEGYLIPDGCPQCMMFNTVDGFGWLVQFLEDLWSLNSWMPSTSATTAYYRRLKATPFYEKNSDDPSAVRRLCGDFSMRGMTHHEAAAISGAGHLLSFDRTATIDANSILEEYYGADLTNNAPGFGTPSLEHSVVEKGVAFFKELILDGSIMTKPKYAEYVSKAMAEKWEDNLIAEMCFMIYLLTKVQPEGNFTYVSDTYDYWGVIGKILPMIKDIIMNRNGKLIMRPDSGDPVQIILGCPAVKDDVITMTHWEMMGTVSSLAEIFGTCFNSKGMKMLNSCIGLIYGDAITADRQDQIMEGLERAGFVPETITLGIGAYTYQYVTRDTRGYAIKATSCTIEGLGEIAIFKEPKTDTSKKSQRGAVVVTFNQSEFNRVGGWFDGYTLEEALKDPWQIMRPIFRDGECMNQETIYDIRNRLWNNNF